MGQIAATRTTSYVRLWVCTRCWLVVPPDRDQCPNSGGRFGELHPIRSYVPEDELPRDNEAGRVAERTVQQIALGSVEAAIACLEAAKAGLRR